MFTLPSNANAEATSQTFLGMAATAATLRAEGLWTWVGFQDSIFEIKMDSNVPLESHHARPPVAVSKLADKSPRGRFRKS